MIDRLCRPNLARLARVLFATCVLIQVLGCAARPKTLGESSWDKRIGSVNVQIEFTDDVLKPDITKRAIEAKLAEYKLLDPLSKSALQVYVVKFAPDQVIAEHTAGWVAIYSARVAVSFGNEQYMFPVESISGPVKGNQVKSYDERFRSLVQMIVGSIAIESRIRN
jgi:hypothetical protein